MYRSLLCRALCSASWSLIPLAALSQDAIPTNTWYVQAASGEESSNGLVLGTTRAWPRTWQLGGGQVRGHWDAWLGVWSGRDLQQQRFHTPALGMGPSLRWRGAQGTSPWFAEVGTGVMVTGKTLYNSGTRMGTRWNFISHLGLGMNLGAQRQHELSLRLHHASNAGLQRPNPGLNLLQLRYAHAF